MDLMLKLPNYRDLPEGVSEEDAAFYEAFVGVAKELQELIISIDKAKQREGKEELFIGPSAFCRAFQFDDIVNLFIDYRCEEEFDAHIKNEIGTKFFQSMDDEERDYLREEFEDAFRDDVSYWYGDWRDNLEEVLFKFNFCALDFSEEPDVYLLNSPQVDIMSPKAVIHIKTIETLSYKERCQMPW